MTRYLASVEERENGRFSLNHDETYAGVLAVAEWVDRKAPFDTVSVYRRSGENLYFNEVDANGKWTQPPRLRQTIEAERSRVWTEQGTQGFLTTTRQARAQVDSLTVQGAPLEPIWLTRIADAAELATPLAAATSRGQLAETIHELRQEAKNRVASASETSRDGAATPPQTDPDVQASLDVLAGTQPANDPPGVAPPSLPSTYTPPVHRDTGPELG